MFALLNAEGAVFLQLEKKKKKNKMCQATRSEKESFVLTAHCGWINYVLFFLKMLFKNVNAEMKPCMTGIRK